VSDLLLFAVLFDGSFLAICGGSQLILCFSRYTLVDFTPPWLHTSISALKYTDKKKFPDLDVTTLSEATQIGAGVCTISDSVAPSVLERLFPGINVVLCTLDKEAEDGCLQHLMEEKCFLLVSDELVLRHMQANEPYFEMTGEQFELQWLSWPVRRSLDREVAFLLNKWMYAAVSNQTVSELYFEYFAKKLCPIGMAGKNCELFCDPEHGSADAAGDCVCASPRWIGGTYTPVVCRICCKISMGISSMVVTPPTCKHILTCLAVEYNILRGLRYRSSRRSQFDSVDADDDLLLYAGMQHFGHYNLWSVAVLAAQKFGGASQSTLLPHVGVVWMLDKFLCHHFHGVTR
jgi:hypothetical protein